MSELEIYASRKNRALFHIILGGGTVLGAGAMGGVLGAALAGTPLSVTMPLVSLVCGYTRILERTYYKALDEMDQAVSELPDVEDMDRMSAELQAAMTTIDAEAAVVAATLVASPDRDPAL